MSTDIAWGLGYLLHHFPDKVCLDPNSAGKRPEKTLPFLFNPGIVLNESFLTHKIYCTDCVAHMVKGFYVLIILIYIINSIQDSILSYMEE